MTILLSLLSVLFMASLALGVSSVSAQSPVRVKALSAGWEHTCAILEHRGESYVACWGSNRFGELGDGTRAQSYRPRLVRTSDGRPLKGVTQISASRYYTCALLDDTSVWCWGWNEGGKLGGGTYDGFNAFRSIIPNEMAFNLVRSYVPYPIQELSTHPVMVRTPDRAFRGVRQISAGSWHACALREDSTVWCWGQNFDGALGIGKSSEELRERLSSMSPVNPFQVLSQMDWSYLFSPHPVQVIESKGSDEPLRDVKLVRAGSSDHTCVLLADGTVRCWAWNGAGEGEAGVNDEETAYFSAPVGPVLREDLRPLTDVIDLAIGGDFTCALTSAGEVWCWGMNDRGQLGTGDVRNRPVAVKVRLKDGSPLSGVKAIYSERGNHICALTQQGLLCWGDNEHGQLGNAELGTGGYSPYPVRVALSEPVLDVAVGGGGRDPLSNSPLQYHGDHTCVLLESGKVLCWGSNTSGQLGRPGESSHVPNEVNFDEVLSELSAGR